MRVQCLSSTVSSVLPTNSMVIYFVCTSLLHTHPTFLLPIGNNICRLQGAWLFGSLGHPLLCNSMHYVFHFNGW